MYHHLPIPSQGMTIKAPDKEDGGRTRRGAKGRTHVSRGYANSQQKIQDEIAKALAVQQAQHQQRMIEQQKYFEEMLRRQKLIYEDADKRKQVQSPWHKYTDLFK
jgi:hypothetical protein